MQMKLKECVDHVTRLVKIVLVQELIVVLLAQKELT